MTLGKIAKEWSNLWLSEINVNVTNSTSHIWRAAVADTLPIVCRLCSEAGHVPDCRWQTSVTQQPAARRGTGTYLIIGLKLQSKMENLKHLPKEFGKNRILIPLLSFFVCFLWAMTFLQPEPRAVSWSVLFCHVNRCYMENRFFGNAALNKVKQALLLKDFWKFCCALTL